MPWPKNNIFLSFANTYLPHPSAYKNPSSLYNLLEALLVARRGCCPIYESLNKAIRSSNLFGWILFLNSSGFFHRNNSHWLNFFHSDTIFSPCLFQPRDFSGSAQLLVSESLALLPLFPSLTLPKPLKLSPHSGIFIRTIWSEFFLLGSCPDIFILYLSFVFCINCEWNSKAAVALYAVFSTTPLGGDGFKALLSMGTSQPASQMPACVLFYCIQGEY